MNTGKQDMFLDRKIIIIVIACFTLVAISIFQHFVSSNETLLSFQQLEPNTDQYESLHGKYPTYKLLDKENNFLIYAVETNASGYGGPISVLTSINSEGIISKVIIKKHSETPAYLKRVLKTNYLESFAGKSVKDSLSPGIDIDTISGATLTAEGVAEAVQKGAAAVANSQLGISVNAKSGIDFGWQELGLLLLYGLILFGVYFKQSKLRPLVQICSVIFLGFFLNAAISLSSFAAIIRGDIPSFLERPFWYILIIGIIIITIILKRNIYCAWLCPFGAIQEGIYKVLGFINLNVSAEITAVVRKIRWGIIWISLMVAIIFHNSSLAGYEPFAVSFGGSGNLGQWLILCLVIITSIFIYRFWCRFFCPVTAILDLLPKLTRQNIKGQKESIKQCAALDCENDHPRCKKCIQENTKPQTDIRKIDKVFSFIIMLYIILITITLLMNLDII